MAMVDLSAVIARRDWAKAHAARVNALAKEWAFGAVDVTHSTTADGLGVIRAEVVGEPPIEVALALGDVLHNARAALDNLVGVLRGGATRTSQFRIDTDPAKFDADEAGRLAGVPDWARAVFRELQPFAGAPGGGIGKGLDDLDKLAILDRHRALLVLGSPVDMARMLGAPARRGATESRTQEGGRVLEITYPADATVDPEVGIAMLVSEDPLKVDRYPGYPTVQEVAAGPVHSVSVVIDRVAQAAARAK
jgi:hypothetical protein